MPGLALLSNLCSKTTKNTFISMKWNTAIMALDASFCPALSQTALKYPVETMLELVFTQQRFLNTPSSMPKFTNTKGNTIK